MKKIDNTFWIGVAQMIAFGGVLFNNYDLAIVLLLFAILWKLQEWNFSR